MDLMLRRRQLMAMQSELPGAYQKVEYLESTWEQYINLYPDTEATNPTSYLRVRADFIMTQIESGKESALFGGKTDASTQTTTLFFSTNNRWLVSWCGAGTSYSIKYLTLGERYSLDTRWDVGSGRSGIINGTEYTSTTANNALNRTGSRHFCLFKDGPRDYSKGDTVYSHLKIYSASVEIDGVVERNLIPCVRKSDSKPGMYDTITKTFFTNAGTGEFIVPV